MESIASHSGTLVPDSHQCLLHDILRFLAIRRYAKGKPEEYVLQRKHIVPKTDFFHFLSITKTILWRVCYGR